MDLERAALRVGRLGQHVVGGLEVRVLRVVLVVGPRKRQHAGTDEEAHVVDVAVSLVEGHAVLQPDDLLQAHVLLEVPLRLFLGEVRVAVVVQHAVLRHDKRPLAVDLHGAALEHHLRGVVRVVVLEVQELRGEFLVALPREVQAALEPAVRVPSPGHAAHVALVVHHVERAFVLRPRVVDGHLNHAHALGQAGAGVLVLVGRAEHRQRLVLDDLLRHLHEDGLGGLAAVAPRVLTLGPDEEVLLARLELSGHAVSVLLRRAVGDDLHDALLR